MWPLTVDWYGNRLDPDYRPRTVGELTGVLRAAGLVDGFWQFS
jgi:hypothetical protein